MMDAETAILNNGTVISIVGSLFVILIAIIGYFFKRELSQFDGIKATLVEIDKKTGAFATISEELESINEKFDIINDKFDSINEKFESVNSKLQTIDKDGSTTKHELEMISNMIKPLFEMKEVVDRTSKDIASLYEKTNQSKDDHMKLVEKIHELEKQIISIKK